jgi:chromosome segregation ATPase
MSIFADNADSMIGRIRALQKEVVRLEKATEEVQDELRTTKRDRDRIARNRDELAASMESLQRMHGEMTERASAAAARVNDLLAEHGQMEKTLNEVETLREALDLANSELTAAKTENVVKGRQLASASATASVREQERDEARADRDAARAEAAEAKAELRDFRTRFDEQAQELASARRMVDALVVSNTR